MDISSCQYQIMATHQLDEMFLAPKTTTSSITTANDHHQTNTQEPKKGGGGGGGLGVASGAAKPQPPGPPLSCPRCDSTNTKFCYYNNYSLSQPRYFCKACRRYWTQGGSLRNVPVGGGCRKNTKRSSSSSSSSSSASKANNKALEQSLPQTLIPTANPSSAINPLLLSLDPSFLLPPNPNPNHNFLDLLRGANNGRFNFGVSGYGAGGVDGGAAEQGQPWQFGNSGRNVSVAVENGNVRDYGYSYWNDVNGAAGAYWNGVVNSSLM